MTFVKPFCGTRYNPKKISEPTDVASWPYDCLTEAERDDFYKRNEYNIIRLIKAKPSPLDSGTDNQFTRAAGDLTHWLENGVLVTDSAPAFYYYRLGYTRADGSQYMRKGFIGLMKISDYDEMKVLPHEKHDPVPVKNRLSLIRSTGANLSPIFATYRDPNRSVISLMVGSLPSEPIIKTSFIDGTEHSIWRITNEEICSSISRTMSERKIMIADGHHRYEAALQFRNLARKNFPNAGPDAPFEYILTYFSPAEDEGITILPTHRAVSGLKNFSTNEFMLKLSKTFYIKEVPIDKQQPDQALKDAMGEAAQLNENANDETFVMGLTGSDSLYLLNFKKDQVNKYYPANVPEKVRSLDVSILQQVVFKNILGIDPATPDPEINIDFFCREDEMFDRLKDGAQFVILLNPTRMETLWTIAEARRLLPTKSSYFFPKVLAGFVLHKF